VGQNPPGYLGGNMATKKEVKEEIAFVEDIPKKAEKTGLYTEEFYNVTLPLTSEKQDDVTVGVNGEITKIQRGEPVKVSAAVYEVLMNSERMDNLAIKRRSALESK
jgi:hypothetical protein